MEEVKGSTTDDLEEWEKKAISEYLRRNKL
jgi:hypothetical protein